MLKEFVEKKHCNFIEEAADWQDAIRKCCQPVVADGTVTENYAEEIIACVNLYGPYMVLMPGVAMPHSQQCGDSVRGTAISFMKTEKPVFFDENDPAMYANLFFTLASDNPEKHLDNMQQLSVILSSEDLIAELMQVTNEEELLALAVRSGL